MNRLVRMTAIAGALVAGLTCKGDGPQGPGTVQVRLSSPAASSGLDSAIIFQITGPTPLTSAAPGGGLRLFAQPLTSNTTRFALIGQLNSGATILTIGVQDIGALNQYTGTVQGVATGTSALRPIVTLYTLSFIR